MGCLPDLMHAPLLLRLFQVLARPSVVIPPPMMLEGGGEAEVPPVMVLDFQVGRRAAAAGWDGVWRIPMMLSEGGSEAEAPLTMMLDF